LATRKCGMKFLNDKWWSMNKEAAYRKILWCTNRDQIGNLSRYLCKDKYKRFRKTKEV
jgi:hypothetical protein